MGAYDRALQRQVELGFSILSLNSQRNYYCCAVSDGFTITHDGLITSCFDVYRPDHPFAGYFIYGSYNRKTKQLDIDHQTLARLRCRNTCRMSSCQACFCKYMCCGDCTVNAMRQGLNLMKGGGRCRITQAIGAFMLAKKIAAIRERIPYCIIADERNDFSLSNAAWADGFGNERPEIFGGVNFPVQESYYMRPPPTEENARQWISDGNAAYRLRDYRKALGQYEKAIQLAPRSADAHNNMALVLHKLGRLPEALGEAEKAVSLSAHTSSSHLTHGKVLVACGRLAEALAAFDRVLALDPGHEGARYNRAWVLAELEKLDEAEGVLSGLTTVADSGSDADVLLQSLRQTQGGSVALTGPSLHRPHAWMIRMNTRLLAGEGVPDDPGDRVKLTSVLDDCSREQYAKARQSMDDLLRSRPSSALLRMLSGMLWQAQGDSGKANADMQMAQGDQR